MRPGLVRHIFSTADNHPKHEQMSSNNVCAIFCSRISLCRVTQQLRFYDDQHQNRFNHRETSIIVVVMLETVSNTPNTASSNEP